MNAILLNKILSKEQKEFGLYLEEDDHNILLKKRGELLPVAVFSRHAAVETIQQEAQQALCEATNGVTYEEVSK